MYQSWSKCIGNNNSFAYLWSNKLPNTSLYILLLFEKSTSSSPSKSRSFDSLHPRYCCYAQHSSQNADKERHMQKIYAIYIPTWWRKSTTRFSNSMSWEAINRLPRRKRDGSSSFPNRITYSALMPWLLRASITDIT